MTIPSIKKQREAQELSSVELRQRTVDGRGVADIRLLQVEDGPGRGQRLLVVRNATRIRFETAPDRGFDISSATWRGINIGWNSANGLPWPANSVDAEDGVGAMLRARCPCPCHGQFRLIKGGDRGFGSRSSVWIETSVSKPNRHRSGDSASLAAPAPCAGAALSMSRNRRAR
ncbi:DUF4432 family protein [Rhizobium jaguaris]|uniref:DUF4432 family protein n=1 Tax=Rhizobium jaguaris TaxID=1312183 RepID=A0A387G2P9_9HYPH|nr:DUF4432 family protein [Rhizobium jaguaris]AYG61846.1 DUF4432 family protein [Rhizobium jaguaris]